MRVGIFVLCCVQISCGIHAVGEAPDNLDVVIGEDGCTDPVNCSGSEPAAGGPVEDPIRPEEWVPPPKPSEEETFGVDLDNDGWDASVDCNDFDASIHPTAYDISCDGIDQNCDGVDTCDTDMDGFVDAIDCDPLDSGITWECTRDPRQEPIP